jgi:hypothetical protein
VHFFRVDGDGMNLELLVRADTFLGSGGVITSFDAFGVDPTGRYYAYVASASGGGQNVVWRDTTKTTPAEIMRNGDSDGGAGTIIDAHTGGRLLVYSDGVLVWVCEGDQVASGRSVDHLLVFFSPTSTSTLVRILARSNDPIDSDAPIIPGNLDEILMLNTDRASTIPLFNGLIDDAPLPLTQGTFGIHPSGLKLETSNVFSGAGGTQPSLYVDLRYPGKPYNEVSGDASLVVAVRWPAGSAIFWFQRNAQGNLEPLTLASDGDPAPGGDTFGDFESQSAHTCANGVVLFRAKLDTAGSGIFRHIRTL